MQQDEQKFAEQCAALNERLKELQDQKEPVTEDRVLSCIVLVRQLKLVGLGDAFWYLTALNGLNAYACEDDGDDFDEFYKDYFGVLAKFLKKQSSELVRMEIQEQSGSNTIYFEIAGVQFSFKNFTITRELEDLVAKDLENPEIQWDGIRKKCCVETLYQFGADNTWEKYELSMSDESISELLEKELARFHAGEQTLREAAGLKERKQTASKSNAVIDTKEYPFRNQPINNFYGGTVKSFLREVKERTMVPFLKKRYEEGYGYSLHQTMEAYWKYQFDALYNELIKTEIGDEAAMLLLYVHNMEMDYFVFLAGSNDDDGGMQSFAVQLLPWVKAQLQENPSQILYQTPMMELDFESVHPSLMMNAFRDYCLQGIFDAERFGCFRLCSFLFDCRLEENTDIVSACPKEYLKLADVVYADQGGRIAELGQEALRGTGGTAIINRIASTLGKSLNALTADFLPDVQYVKTSFTESMQQESCGFSAVHERSAGKHHRNAEEFCAELNEKGIRSCLIRTAGDQSRIPCGTKVLIYDEWIPGGIDYAKAPYQILFYDQYTRTEEESEKLEVLMDRAGDRGGVHYYAITSCRDFCDLGGGNNWLIRQFSLGLMQSQLWDPSNYEIKVLDSAGDFTRKEGVALVTVPKEIAFDMAERAVLSSRSAQIALYLKLSEGSRGVALVIEDAALRDCISSVLKDYAYSYHWVSQYQRVESGNEQVMEVREDITGDSSVHFRAESAACKALGLSAYQKLCEDSRNWLLSSLISYYDMRNVSQIMDYTGVVLMICKCYEEELKVRIAEDYVEWAKDTYGDQYLDHVTKELQDKNGTGIIDYDTISIGSYPYIMGYYPEGGVHNGKDKDEFQKYAEDHLLTDPSCAEETIKYFVKVITHVRTRYRNKAAHTEPIDVVLATDCVEYCVTKDRTLGVILDACKY